MPPDNSRSEQTDWEERVRLSEETTYVAIYPPRSHAETWMEEAEAEDKSRSQYLHELIQQARAMRADGETMFSADGSREEELRQRITQLEDKLARARQHDTETANVHDEGVVTSHLSESYRPIDELIEDIAASDALKAQLRESTEDMLFDLVDRDEVEFKSGYGWRLAQEGDE